MTTLLMGLYIKLNLLLAAALLLWLATKAFARLLGFEINAAQQLKVVRVLFLGLLASVTLVLFINTLVPGWLGAIAGSLSAPLLTDEMTVVAGLNDSLGQRYTLGTLTFEPGMLLYALLLAGLALQLARLALQLRKLQTIVEGATEWKCIRGTHLLVSSQIATPFSTRALGNKHVVLPMSLLASPSNLRLAVKHELQHVRNGDLEWVILLEAVKVLCFWNPAAWLWHNEFDCLQEFACDEVLIHERRVGSQAYGNCLLEVASASNGNALVAASNMVPKFSLLLNQRSQLKRRIQMLAHVSNNKHATLKSLGYGLLAGVGLMNAALVVFAADTETSAESRNLMPITRINPEYPVQALSEGLQGWVQLEFSVDAAGNVSNVSVVKNCVWPQTGTEEECTANTLFDEVATTALAQWKYAPSTGDGSAVKAEGVQTIMKFTLMDSEDTESPEQ